MIPLEKQTLRKQMFATLAAFSDHRTLASQKIAHRLRALPLWEKATVIYAFSPLANEPDWRMGFTHQDKQIAYPRVVGDAMLFYIAEKFERGALGTWEPVGDVLAPPADLILVPGLAFDSTGHRLGRGKGFYDRWLSERGPAPAIGLCFQCQIIPEVPREPHDVPVNQVLTEQS